MSGERIVLNEAMFDFKSIKTKDQKKQEKEQQELKKQEKARTPSVQKSHLELQGSFINEIFGFMFNPKNAGMLSPLVRKTIKTDGEKTINAGYSISPVLSTKEPIQVTDENGKIIGYESKDINIESLNKAWDMITGTINGKQRIKVNNHIYSVIITEVYYLKSLSQCAIRNQNDIYAKIESGDIILPNKHYVAKVEGIDKLIDYYTDDDKLVKVKAINGGITEAPKSFVNELNSIYDSIDFVKFLQAKFDPEQLLNINGCVALKDERGIIYTKIENQWYKQLTDQDTPLFKKVELATYHDPSLPEKPDLPADHWLKKYYKEKNGYIKQAKANGVDETRYGKLFDWNILSDPGEVKPSGMNDNEYADRKRISNAIRVIASKLDQAYKDNDYDLVHKLTDQDNLAEINELIMRDPKTESLSGVDFRINRDDISTFNLLYNADGLAKRSCLFKSIISSLDWRLLEKAKQVVCSNFKNGDSELDSDIYNKIKSVGNDEDYKLLDPTTIVNYLFRLQGKTAGNRFYTGDVSSQIWEQLGSNGMNLAATHYNKAKSLLEDIFVKSVGKEEEAKVKANDIVSSWMKLSTGFGRSKAFIREFKKSAYFGNIKQIYSLINSLDKTINKISDIDTSDVRKFGSSLISECHIDKYKSLFGNLADSIRATTKELEASKKSVVRSEEERLKHAQYISSSVIDVKIYSAIFGDIADDVDSLNHLDNIENYIKSLNNKSNNDELKQEIINSYKMIIKQLEYYIEKMQQYTTKGGINVAASRVVAEAAKSVGSSDVKHLVHEAAAHVMCSIFWNKTYDNLTGMTKHATKSGADGIAKVMSRRGEKYIAVIPEDGNLKLAKLYKINSGYKSDINTGDRVINGDILMSKTKTDIYSQDSVPGMETLANFITGVSLGRLTEKLKTKKSKLTDEEKIEYYLRNKKYDFPNGNYYAIYDGVIINIDNDIINIKYSNSDQEEFEDNIKINGRKVIVHKDDVVKKGDLLIEANFDAYMSIVDLYDKDYIATYNGIIKEIDNDYVYIEYKSRLPRYEENLLVRVPINSRTVNIVVGDKFNKGDVILNAVKMTQEEESKVDQELFEFLKDSDDFGSINLSDYIRTHDLSEVKEYILDFNITPDNNDLYTAIECGKYNIYFYLLNDTNINKVKALSDLDLSDLILNDETLEYYIDALDGSFGYHPNEKDLIGAIEIGNDNLITQLLNSNIEITINHIAYAFNSNKKKLALVLYNKLMNSYEMSGNNDLAARLKVNINKYCPGLVDTSEIQKVNIDDLLSEEKWEEAYILLLNDCVTTDKSFNLASKSTNINLIDELSKYAKFNDKSLKLLLNNHYLIKSAKQDNKVCDLFCDVVSRVVNSVGIDKLSMKIAILSGIDRIIETIIKADKDSIKILDEFGYDYSKMVDDAVVFIKLYDEYNQVINSDAYIGDPISVCKKLNSDNFDIDPSYVFNEHVVGILRKNDIENKFDEYIDYLIDHGRRLNTEQLIFLVDNNMVKSLEVIGQKVDSKRILIDPYVIIELSKLTKNTDVLSILNFILSKYGVNADDASNRLIKFIKTGDVSGVKYEDFMYMAGDGRYTIFAVIARDKMLCKMLFNNILNIIPDDVIAKLETKNKEENNKYYNDEHSKKLFWFKKFINTLSGESVSKRPFKSKLDNLEERRTVSVMLEYIAGKTNSFEEIRKLFDPNTAVNFSDLIQVLNYMVEGSRSEEDMKYINNFVGNYIKTNGLSLRDIIAISNLGKVVDHEKPKEWLSDEIENLKKEYKLISNDSLDLSSKIEQFVKMKYHELSKEDRAERVKSVAHYANEDTKVSADDIKNFVSIIVKYLDNLELNRMFDRMVKYVSGELYNNSKEILDNLNSDDNKKFDAVVNKIMGDGYNIAIFIDAFNDRISEKSNLTVDDIRYYSEDNINKLINDIESMRAEEVQQYISQELDKAKNTLSNVNKIALMDEYKDKVEALNKMKIRIGKYIEFLKNVVASKSKGSSGVKLAYNAIIRQFSKWHYMIEEGNITIDLSDVYQIIDNIDNINVLRKTSSSLEVIDGDVREYKEQMSNVIAMRQNYVKNKEEFETKLKTTHVENEINKINNAIKELNDKIEKADKIIVDNNYVNKIDVCNTISDFIAEVKNYISSVIKNSKADLPQMV